MTTLKLQFYIEKSFEMDNLSKIMKKRQPIRAQYRWELLQYRIKKHFRVRPEETGLMTILQIQGKCICLKKKKISLSEFKTFVKSGISVNIDGM